MSLTVKKIANIKDILKETRTTISRYNNNKILIFPRKLVPRLFEIRFNYDFPYLAILYTFCTIVESSRYLSMLYKSHLQVLSI